MDISQTIFDKPEVKFTEWQIYTLRKGITAFRLDNIYNGEMPSLSYVAFEIESFRPENSAHEDTDENYLLKEERIRRFLEGENVGSEKLQLMKDFLIDSETLTEKDFSSELDDTHEFLKVHTFLANINKLAKKKLSQLKPSLIASRQTSSASERIRLDIQPDPSGLFFRVVEHSENNVPESPYPPQEIAIKKDKGIKGQKYRRGYGFASTKDNLIHIFVRGANPLDRVTYTETIHYPLKLNNKGRVFIRHGGTIFNSTPEENLEDKVVRCLNVYNFLPEERATRPGERV